MMSPELSKRIRETAQECMKELSRVDVGNADTNATNALAQLSVYVAEEIIATVHDQFQEEARRYARTLVLRTFDQFIEGK
jgi:hypothetical protein